MESLYENSNFISVCEFLPNHLYFVTVQNINNGGSCDAVIPHTDDFHYFNTDNELIYHNFYGDFGPLSITCLYKFCKKLTNKLATYGGEEFYDKFTISRFGKKEIVEKLQEKFVKNKCVVYYTSTNNEKRANAAFLIAAYAVLYLGYSPRLAYKALQPTKMKFRPFQDASVGLSPYKISMKDCLDALHKASAFGFFNFNDFNASECNYYENIEHGDLNWIIPQKFIAFPGPVEEKNDYYHHPNFYIEYFLNNNVTDVIRLNQRAYDPKCFTMFNIRHHDLYMQDGTDPPDAILKAFLSIAENASGAIAVHCKAGLGRTGSLIGAYLLKHYRMTAKEAIAWTRICRPGSVIGHQQTWLEKHEEVLWYEGNQWRYKVYGKTEIVPFMQYGIYSFESPKKIFPGLRELLTNLTKKSRYRFIVKNRSKKSKTRLQQMIKTLLENGKSTKEPKTDEKQVKQEVLSVQQDSNYEGQKISQSKMEDTKNVEYLKAPPQDNNQVFNYEYSPQEYRKVLPNRDYDPVTNYQKAMEVMAPNYAPFPPPYDGKLEAMYANPNSFYTNYAESDFSQYGYDKRPSAQINAGRMPRSITIPKAYSEETPPRGFDQVRPNSMMSKSIDKNWKQNPTGPRYYTPDVLNRKMGKVVAAAKPSAEEFCAFDTRVDTISQYSRFNKPYLNKSYLDQNRLMDNDLYNETKLKSYDYTKSKGRSHGFLLSPEDLQSWVETFEDKMDETSGMKPYSIKRPTVT